MRASVLAVAALTALPALSLSSLPGRARAQTAPILPGYWESADSYSVLLSGGSHDRKCLTPAEVAEFMTTPQTKRYHCTYASRTVSDGRAVFRDGSCFNKNGRQVLSNVNVDGRYTPETFHLDFHFKLQVSAGVGLPGNAVIDARRLSATCPTSAPPGE